MPATHHHNPALGAAGRPAPWSRNRHPVANAWPTPQPTPQRRSDEPFDHAALALSTAHLIAGASASLPTRLVTNNKGPATHRSEWLALWA